MVINIALKSHVNQSRKLIHTITMYSEHFVLSSYLSVNLKENFKEFVRIEK